MFPTRPLPSEADMTGSPRDVAEGPLAEAVRPRRIRDQNLLADRRIGRPDRGRCIGMRLMAIANLANLHF